MIRFGPFEIDRRTWSLSREDVAVDLSPRLVEILACLAENPGTIVTKEELLERFWPGVNITDNTLTRAIADIRIAIGDSAAEPRYIQTLPRRGYRFIGASSRSSPESERAKADASGVTDPFQDWVKGRLALDSLDLAKLGEAVIAFERAAAELPRYAPAHAGLANAYLLQYEKTRSGSVPDRQLLSRALGAAKQAAAVDGSLGEAWAVLGYLLCAAGQIEEGQAAARRATALEPDNWRHQYRLAYATWGEERLRAVDRTLALMPGFAPARMLSGMVFIARGAFDRAERDASIGAEAQRQHASDHTPLPAVGLHWLRGLILASKGDPRGAVACFDEEKTAGSTGHIYAREFAVNALVAAGFTHLAQKNSQAASAAFTQALAEAANHPKALVGMYAVAALAGDQSALDAARTATEAAIADLVRGERHVEAGLVAAGAHIVRGRVDDAVEGLDRLLTTAPAGPAGWIIPVDPMLAAIHGTRGAPALFSRLAARAA